MKVTALTTAIPALLLGLIIAGCAGKPVPQNEPTAPAKTEATPTAPDKTTPEPINKPVDVNALAASAVTQLEAGNYTKAIDIFQDVLNNAGKNDDIIATTYYNLACTYSLMKQKEPALQNLSKAIASGYDNADWMAQDKDLDFLRDMPEYQVVISQIPPIEEITPTPEDFKAQEEALQLIEKYRGLKCKEPPKFKIMEPQQFARAFGGDATTIQGFYRWADKYLYLKTGLDPVRSKGTRIHETFHAIQDQLFNISALHKEVKTTDGNYALTALIEGDATLTFIECMPESMARMMLVSATPWRMGGAKPRYDNSERGEAASRRGAFGYSTAALFVQAIKDAKGWAGVDALYASLPPSTEWVLHPEKCITPDASGTPIIITLPDFTALLGADWNVSQPDTQGEFGILLNLAGNEKSGPLSEAAAAGWGGDTYMVVSNPKQRQQRFFIQKTAWDTANDAKEFYEASGLSLERNEQPEKGENFIKYKEADGAVDYAAIKDNTVILLYSVPESIFEKVLSALTEK